MIVSRPARSPSGLSVKEVPVFRSASSSSRIHAQEMPVFLDQEALLHVYRQEFNPEQSPYGKDIDHQDFVRHAQTIQKSAKDFIASLERLQEKPRLLDDFKLIEISSLYNFFNAGFDTLIDQVHLTNLDMAPILSLKQSLNESIHQIYQALQNPVVMQVSAVHKNLSAYQDFKNVVLHQSLLRDADTQSLPQLYDLETLTRRFSKPYLNKETIIPVSDKTRQRKEVSSLREVLIPDTKTFSKQLKDFSKKPQDVTAQHLKKIMQSYREFKDYLRPFMQEVFGVERQWAVSAYEDISNRLKEFHRTLEMSMRQTGEPFFDEPNDYIDFKIFMTTEAKLF